jgi:virginiamycin A acetyltransferase
MARIKMLLKLGLLILFTVLVSPLIAIAKLEQWLTKSEGWFSGIGEMLSLIPGKTGSYFRLAYYHATLKQCGRDAIFLLGTSINHRAAIIGRGVVFGTHCNIGTVSIGNYCLIGTRVSIPSGGRQHNFMDLTKNITEHSPLFQCVHIGANTWIGEGAIVMADVGTRCVVAAGSVVYRPVPDHYNAMGNPARIISQDFSAAAPAEKPIAEAAAG